MCAIAAVVEWFALYPFTSIFPAAVAVLAGVVGIVREPRGRALAIVSLIPSGVILAFWAYFVVLTYFTFASA